MGIFVAFILAISNPVISDMVTDIEVENSDNYVGDFENEDMEDIVEYNYTPDSDFSEDPGNDGQDLLLSDSSDNGMELKLDFICRYQIIECFLLTLCSGALVTQIIIHWYTR